jgi:hypothetical protein
MRKSATPSPATSLSACLMAAGFIWKSDRSGAKLWRFRYRIAGKENIFAIGEYFSDKREGHVSLDDARKERDKARALVNQGIHPAHQRQAERLATHTESANTFEAVTREWIAKKKPTWTPYYLRQVERFMEADVFPKIGKHPIRNVTAAHLLEIVQGNRRARRGNRGLAGAAMGFGSLPLRCGNPAGGRRSGGGIEGGDSPTEDRASQAPDPRPDKGIHQSP